MSTPYLGEIRIFPWDFAVKGWALCAGQLLSIQQNAALFSILGTTYGGNGSTTFALPDFRGRTSLGFGGGPGLSPRSLGEVGGQESVTLVTSQMPQHNHLVQASSSDGTQAPPANGYLSKIQRAGIGYLNGYAAPGGAPQVLGNQLSNGGGSQPHPNMQPYLTLNYSIALQGIFPSRN